MGDEKDPQQTLPTTLESLGNHLHAQITTRFPQLTYSLVSKVTGVLLECGETEVLAMLQNGSQLQKRMSQVLTILSSRDGNSQNKLSQNTDVVTDWTDNDSEELFDKVAAIDPRHCAKITGMLLEGDKSFLKQTLTDDELLKSAVYKARLTYLQSLGVISSPSSSVCDARNKDEGSLSSNDNDLDDPLTDIGNILYSQIEMWYPGLAEKITGMLLEIPNEELELTINDSDLLKRRAVKAYDTLKNSGYLTLYYESSTEKWKKKPL